MAEINNLSLYIPHVFSNFDENYIRGSFKKFGDVKKIDFVAKQDRHGNNYNAVYIHFNEWYMHKKSTIAFYNNVLDENKEARLYYDEPWYWIVLPNTAKKYIPGERREKIKIDKVALSQKSDDNVSFDEVAKFEAEIEAEMDEIEEMLDAEEDSNIIEIDRRYVQEIEQENLAMRAEIAQLRVSLINLEQMYQEEANKVKAVNSVDL